MVDKEGGDDEEDEEDEDEGDWTCAVAAEEDDDDDEDNDDDDDDGGGGPELFAATAAAGDASCCSLLLSKPEISTAPFASFKPAPLAGDNSISPPSSSLLPHRSMISSDAALLIGRAFPEGRRLQCGRAFKPVEGGQGGREGAPD